MGIEAQNHFNLSLSTAPIPPLDRYCKGVHDVLNLQWEKSWKLIFVWGVEWWWNDHSISISYSISIRSKRHWQDKSSYDEIDIQFGDFEGIFNWLKIWKWQEDQMKIDLYLDSQGINLIAEVRKAYFGE